MNYNAVISSQDVTEESGSITEPVTLQEMKDYLRLNGYEAVGDSPATFSGDINFDDNLITDMIQAGRELMEEKAGISIINHTWESVITNLCGMSEIPFGPVVEITSFKDDSGNDISSYTLVGNLWKFIKSPCYKNMVLTYTAGFGNAATATLPKGIKTDLMELVAAMYRNHETPGAIDIDKVCFKMVSKYSRKTAII